MRVTIKFDSATTEQVRELSVALHRVTGDNTLTLGVNGPECWGGETRPLTPTQFAQVTARLTKFEGVPIADVLDGLRKD